MTTAKRRINSTGRKRIPQDAVDIRMLETGAGEPLKATAALDLDRFGFPPAAKVAIEAYHRSSGMRFDCGTVGHLAIPPVLRMDEVDRSAAVLFRVKVIDDSDRKGLLLGSAERVRARSEQETEGRRSLFPVAKRDLGPVVWKVDVGPDIPPILVLNNAIPGFEYKLLESPFLRGILLPAALRTVIEKLVEDPSADDEDDADWKAEWIQYCREELGMVEDPSDLNTDEDREPWIDDAIRRFSEKGDFVAGIREQMDQEH